MEAYERSTAPLTGFYGRKGLLVRITAEGSPEQIFDRTLESLQSRFKRADEAVTR